MRRRLIAHNIVMFIIPLIVSILVFGISINYISKHYFSDNNHEQTLASGTQKIIDYLDNVETLSIKELENVCSSNGFSILIKSNGEICYKNFNDEEVVLQGIKANSINPIIYQVNGRTIIVRKVIDSAIEYETYAISKKSNVAKLTLTLLQIYLIIALLIPFICVVISNYFISNHMVSSIVVPLRSLVQSANRIRRGDLNCEVKLSDYEELNELCIAFDAMRLQLKENVEKTVLYENNRKELIAGISHDLKTPITVIQGYAKGLLDGVATDSEKQKQYLQTIYRKSFEIETLLNQLILFSKLETKSLVFNFEKCNLDNYLLKIINQFKEDYQNNSLIINYHNCCKDVMIKLDQNQMNRVITNILSNSLKYSDKEQVIIDIDCYLNGQKEVVIKIKDNGIGVSEENLENIFDSFFRVDESRSTRVEGNGLGLSISKYIVEAHEGRIKAKSENGLIIEITLPKGEWNARRS